jgi:hypothetical protein
MIFSNPFHPQKAEEVMTFKGYYEGRCVDWKRVIFEPVVLPKELFELEGKRNEEG